MIVYSDPNTNERLYDTHTLRKTLNVSLSYLKRELRKYPFKEGDYIRFKNLHLYKENSVIDFIEYLVENRLENEIKDLKRDINKMMKRNGLQ